MTYYPPREPTRQAPDLAARRGQEPAFHPSRAPGGWVPAQALAAWGFDRNAGIPAHAEHRGRCHELRINDASGNWRLVYRIDSDAIVIVEVFSKKTQATPKAVVDVCRRRLKEYDHAGQ